MSIIIIKLQFLIAHNSYQKGIRFLRSQCIFVYLRQIYNKIQNTIKYNQIHQNTIYKNFFCNSCQIWLILCFDKTSLRELTCNIILYPSFDSSTRMTYFCKFPVKLNTDILQPFLLRDHIDYIENQCSKPLPDCSYTVSSRDLTVIANDDILYSRTVQDCERFCDDVS